MRKCYIIECPVCGKLTHVFRKDALTCGSACRVRLHRDPKILDAAKKVAMDMRIRVFDLLEAQAVRRLRPDLVEKLKRGEFSGFDPLRGEVEPLDKIRGEIVKKYAELATDTPKAAAKAFRYLLGIRHRKGNK